MSRIMAESRRLALGRCRSRKTASSTGLRQEPESGEYPPSRSVEDVLANKDGVLSENLLEFKLSVSE